MGDGKQESGGLLAIKISTLELSVSSLINLI